jgi:hypothetical protein
LAFVEVTSIIGGHDAVEEFLSCGLWPLSEKFHFKVEAKESPLSKVFVLMPHVTPVIGAQEPGAAFEARILNAVNLLVGTIILWNTMSIESFGMDDSIAFLSWPWYALPALARTNCAEAQVCSRSSGSTVEEGFEKMEGCQRIILFWDSYLHARTCFG